MSSERWAPLDIFKAIAVFIMAIGHSLIFWLSPNDQSLVEVASESQIYFTSLFIKIVEVFPMALPVTAGISFRFMLNRFWTSNQKIKFNETKNYFYFLKRGIMLMLLGFLMNYLTWGLNSGNFFFWDVLQFIPLCMLFSILFLRFLSVKWLYFGAVLIFILTPIYRDSVNYASDNIFSIILLGDIRGNHYWPFFPWVSTFIFGIWIGDLKLTSINNDKIFKYHFLLIGLIGYVLFKFLGIGAIEINPENIWGPYLFMPSLDHSIMILFKFLILFSIICHAESFLKSKPKFHVINIYGKEILIIYIVHTILSYHCAIILYHYNYHTNLIFIAFILFQPFLAYFIGLSTFLIKSKFTGNIFKLYFNNT